MNKRPKTFGWLVLLLALSPFLASSHAGEVSGTLGASTTWDSTAADYVIDNFNGPLVIPAGVTLTVASGVTLRVKYSNKSALEVRGALLAQGANLHLRTSNSSAGGKTAIRVLENGVVTLADCQVSGVHEGVFAEDSRLIEASGSAKSTLRGTRFVTGVSGTAVSHALLIAGAATVECLLSTSGSSNRIAGFRTSLRVTSTAAAAIASTTFEGYSEGLWFTGGAATVADCLFIGSGDARAIRFDPDERDLTVERCAFTAGARAVVFDAEGGDLTVRNSTFTGCTIAIEALKVDALALHDTTISGAGGVKARTGLHTEGMASFSAVDCVIRQQERGIYVQHTQRGIDVSGVTFADNDFDLYSGGTLTLPSTLTSDMALLPGEYRINNASGEITIAAGATLTLPRGVVIQNQSPSQDLFKVQGGLVAEGVRFDLLGEYGRARIVLAEGGSAQFTDCDFYASEKRPWYTTGAILTALDQSSLSVVTCRFVTDNAAGYPVQAAMVLSGDSSGSVSGGEAAASSFRGFPIALDAQATRDVVVQHSVFQANALGLRCATDANVLLDTCTFTGNQTAIQFQRIGFWSATAVLIENNQRGLDFGRHWAYAAYQREGFSFRNNLNEILLQTRGAAIEENLTLQAGAYSVDCDGESGTGSPLKIPVGVTLTIPEGTSLRTVDATESSNPGYTTFELFEVAGTLVAQGATFELRTVSDVRAPQMSTRSIAILGDGTVHLAGCTIRAGDRLRELEPNGWYVGQQGRVFQVSGQGSLTLAGCTLSTGESANAGDATWRVAYGIVTLDQGQLTLESHQGTSTTLEGFSIAGLAVQGAETLHLGTSIFQGCERGVDYGANWYATRFDSSALVMRQNKHDRHLRTRDGVLATDLVMSAGTYTVDCDGEPNTGSPLLIAAGATLTIPTGTTLRTVDTAENGWEGFTYQLFRVEGTLVAEGATFELRTLSRLGVPQNETRVITVGGEGTARFSGCTIRAGDRSRHFQDHPYYDSRQGRVFEVGGQGSLTLAGCTLTTTESTSPGDATWRVGFGVVTEAQGRLTLGIHGGTSTSFEGFATAGLAVRSTGDWEAGTASFKRCERGVDFGGNWMGTRSDTSALVMNENKYDRYLRTRDGVLESDLVMSAGNYTVDCDGEPNTGSPLLIAAEATLTIPTGTTLRTVDTVENGWEGFTYQLFRVEGTLVAEGATFELRTLSRLGVPHNETRAITVGGDGTARFSSCTIRAGDRSRHFEDHPYYDSRQGRVFEVGGRGSLTLAGCTLTTAESTSPGDATWRVGYGVVTEAQGRLTLGIHGGTSTSFEGFATAGLAVRSTGDWEAGTASFKHCERGVDFGGNWLGTRSDTSALVMNENKYDRYLRTRDGVLESDLVMSAGNYTVDCDGEPNTGSPLLIAAGSTLTIPTGTTLRTVDTVENGWEGFTYQLFRVEGTLVAEGATFELRTLSRLGVPQNETRVITVGGEGTARFSSCTIRAGDRSRHFEDHPYYDSRQGRVFEVGGRGSLTLAGCTLSTAESGADGDATWRTGYGVVAKDGGSLTLSSLATRQTVVEGFANAGIVMLGSASLVVRDVDIRHCQTGLHYAATGSAALEGLAISGCVVGLDHYGNPMALDVSAVTFTGNGLDHPVRGRFVVSGDAVLPPGAYDLDASEGPWTVPKGSRLFLAPGVSLRCFLDSSSTNRQFFIVEGQLAGTNATLRMQTRSPNDGRVFQGILARGDGMVALTDCRLEASDAAGTRLGAMIFVEDTAAVRLTRCELVDTDEDGFRTYHGVVHAGTGRVTIEDSSFMGFEVGLRFAGVPREPQLHGNRFLGNTTYAVSNETSQDLDCRENWWGHPTGPRHRSNPLAQGDPISDRVLYLPYVTETDLPTIGLGDHPAGQATNTFATSAVGGDGVLFRFALRDPRATPVLAVNLEILDTENLSEANWTQLRLVQDLNADGVVDGDTEPVLAPGEIRWSEGRLRFAGEFPAHGDFLVTGHLVDIPSGAAAKLRLTFLDVKVGLGTFVVGAVRDAVHYRDRVWLGDHGAWSYTDQLSARETQMAVTLNAFHLGPGCMVRQYRFQLANVFGVEARQFQEVELVTDLNGNGLAEADEPRLRDGRVAVGNGAGTITFDASSPPVASGNHHLLRATLSELRAGDTFSVSLPKSGLVTTDPGTVVSGSTRTVRHEVESPLFVLDAGFQVDNQFLEAEQLLKVPLLGFTFVPQGKTITRLQFGLADVSGIGEWELTNARIYRDDNRNGQLEAREISNVAGAGRVEIDAPRGAGTITFSTPFTAQGSYLLVADVAHLDQDDGLTVDLSSSEVEAGANEVVDGGVSPVRHAVPRPGLVASHLQQNWTLTWRSPGGLQVCGGYSRDGSQAVIGYGSGAAYVYDLQSGVPKRMLMRHFDRVQYAGFSADDRQIITVTRDGAIYLWNAESGDLERLLFADVLVRYAVPSPDFTRLLVVTEGRAFLLSLLDERQLWEFTVGEDFHSVDFSPDGNRVVLGCADKRAYVLDAETGQIPKVTKGGIQYELIFQGHHDTVHGVAFTANGTRLMTASRDATATLWRAEDPVNPIYTISLNDQRCDFAWVNETGTRVAMVTNNRFLRMYDEEGRELYSEELAAGQYTGAAGFAVFSDDGSEFMLGSNHLHDRGSVVARLRTADHAFLHTVGPTGLITANFDSPVRMSGDGRRIFFMKNDGLEVLQRKTGVPIRRYDELTAASPYDITPDGNKLAWLSWTHTSQHSLLRLAVVDDDRLTPVAAHTIDQAMAPLSLSKSGGLALVSDKIFRAASGDVYADSPNTDGAYRNAFSPNGDLWGIGISQPNNYSIKTMRTTDASGSLEFGVTLTGTYQPVKVLYHPDGVRVGCVFPGGVQFYRLDNNTPVGLYDHRGHGLQDAVLSNDGSMLLVARANSARLYDMRTGRVLRYFYPLHSGQDTCLVRSIAFGSRDDIVMIAWSDNYIETYERSRLVGLEVTPLARTLPPTATQEFRVEALYDDGSRLNVTPRAYRSGESAPGGAQLSADPPGMVDLAEGRVTLSAQATGTIVLTAAYSEGGVTRSATARITVGPCPLVSLTPNVPEITLTHGVVMPVYFTATYADGYQETVAPVLSVDAPEHVKIAGNNLTVLRSSGTRNLTITGTFTSRGVTRSAVMHVITHGPQSNWVRSQITSGGDVMAMDYRPDGHQLAVGGSSGAIALYAVGPSPTAYELEAVVPAHERAIRRLFYVSTNELVSVGEDGWIRTWSLADTRQPVREYSHDAAITCAAYFDGWLAFGDNLGRVHALLPGQNRLVWSRAVHDRPVRGIAVDEDAVFSGGDDRKAVLSRRSDGSQVRIYPGYSESIMAVGMRHGMTYTVSEDRRIVEWTKGTVDENLWEFFLPGLPSAIHQNQDRLYVTVGSEKTTMEDDQAVITGYRSTTWVYDDGGLLLHQMEHPPQEGRVTALAASPDGELLLTGRSTLVLQAKNAATGEVEWKHFPFHSVQFWSATRSSYRGSLDHNRSIESARVTRDGSWLYTLSPERVFRWHLGAEIERSKFLETGYDIPYQFEGLSLSDDPTGTVVTRVGETLYLLDGAERRLRMSVHHPGASTFDLSPDSRRLVSDGDNLRLWDVSVDFPTVIHEVLEKRAQCLAFFPSCLPDRQGDWVAGLNDLDFGSDQGGPWEPFLAVMNDRGLQFSGLTLPLPEDPEGEILGARMKPVVAVARNQSRCVVVAQPVSRDAFGGWVALDRAYLYIIDLCTTDEGVNPRLLRRIECDARDARVAVALSDDGSLLFYGGAPTDDQGAAPGQLLDISTGRLLFTFAPPSMGTMANQGPAAAQFTRNDAALMIAWGEGYSSIHLRQGLDRLELTPVVKTVSPGEAVPLQATAIYVDGSRMDVTAEAQWSLQTTPHATLSGPKLVVDGSAPTGAALQVKAVYDGMGATREALSRFTVDVPKFLELTADPLRRSVAPGSEVIVRYFARMADGSTRDVSTLTTLTADPIDRVLIETNRVRVPAFAQAGYVQIEGRCVLDGDERTVLSVLRIRDALEVGNPGDFDGDGQVAFPDVLHLVAHYGLQPSSARWDARCDFNGNLVIDFPDVLALVALYGKTYDAPRLHGDPAVTDGEVLAHLRLEGPMGPVVVGQPFEVRIYARESTTEAAGITGVLLDMRFDTDHIGVVQPFDPAVAIASPYRSILVHGTAGGPGIDELGGVCLEGGHGDGAEVLFATLQFTARVAGETALQLAPGESGLALTQPAGLLSTDRVDYGPPWVVRIVEGAVPPAANEFLGRLEVTRPSLRQTLRYATKAGASVGFVPQEGDARGLPPGEAGEGAWLSLGDQLLGTDVRPTTLGQVWQVRFVVPPGALAGQAWNLSWMPTDVPEGTGLLLLPADRDGNPAPGPRRSLRQEGALRMENAGEEPIAVNFLIAWDRSTTQTWRLEPGWNLVGCSLEPDETTAAALLEHPGLRAMLQWTPSRGYSIPEALDSRRGYLVYVDAPLEFLLTGVPVVAGVCRLEPGWNLVSPMLSDGTGSAPAMESQPGRARWVLIPGEQPVLWQVPGPR